MFLIQAKRVVIVIIGAILNAIALNFFLIGAHVYASGFTGISQILSTVFIEYLGMENISTGILLFILNIPVAIVGWLMVGKGFTIYSFLSVIVTSLFLEMLPILSLSNDIMLNAVFGGVIAGVGVGISLKWGASTGGSDIIAMILSRMKDKPIGGYLMAINGLIILVAGLLNEPENALYTLIGLYVTTRVIDGIHTRHEKVTAMIVTKKADELQQAIHDTMIRGITILPVKGAYTKEDKNMLYLVITRYELFDLERIIHEVDENAFTNVIQTAGVYGFFRRND
ncbi:membrane protein [Gracilibacillus boraciitolerans JCM 21714]|uniref:Membrane protein n=1 Tax=Gracilibacillus boraciitolerans JCM 21714 TaxID=1298598 RepID=W4VK70_9BACI|nr:YitT family protein [Gracilibacillus boraciitolerans]GAE93607.1 membrane protein [Gracilibacillus boraciitolerans JCM 21714]